MYSKNKKTKILQKCDYITPHNGKICLICNPEARGINNIPYYVEINPDCNKHKNCKSIYFDKDQNKYICWECFKEKFERNNISNNSGINKLKILPKSLICKQCSKIMDPYNSRFCSDECKIEFTQSHKSMFKEGNKCEKHPDESLIYGKVCWSCYQENFKEQKYSNDSIKFFLDDLKIYYPNAYI